MFASSARLIFVGVIAPLGAITYRQTSDKSWMMRTFDFWASLPSAVRFSSGA
jgi:hypothetical protein